jgi:hypothetical protein
VTTTINSATGAGPAGFPIPGVLGDPSVLKVGTTIDVFIDSDGSTASLGTSASAQGGLIGFTSAGCSSLPWCFSNISGLGVGTALISNPTAHNWTSGPLVYGVMPNGQMEQYTQPSGGFSSTWIVLTLNAYFTSGSSTTFTGDPISVQSPSGTVACLFVRGTNGDLWGMQYIAGTGWVLADHSLGTPGIVGNPSVAVDAGGNYHVQVANINAHMMDYVELVSAGTWASYDITSYASGPAIIGNVASVQASGTSASIQAFVATT